MIIPDNYAFASFDAFSQFTKCQDTFPKFWR